MSGPPAPVLDPTVEDRFERGARFTGEFHMGTSNIHRALRRLVERLDALEVPYAIVGALALNAYGYQRATTDIDVLLTADGVERFKEAHLGRGYRERFPGSRSLRDTEDGVDIDVVLAGQYPGDGKPKPVRFPDPATCAIRGRAHALVSLPLLVELKLASGMTAPHRLRDLADVIEIIRANRLAREWSDDLDPSVRDKYAELWRAAQGDETDFDTGGSAAPGE